jgi:hypothetical protein
MDGAVHGICDTVSRESSAHFGAGFRALILTGSLARGEGSFVEEDGKYVALSDAEFLLVLHSHRALPPDAEVTELIRRIQTSLTGCGILCKVSVGVCHDDFLRRLQPRVFSHELRCHGRVIAGEQEILRLIPPFLAAEIPLEDGWQTLANRITEQLSLAGELNGCPDTLSPEAQYQSIKFVLDMATSFLLFAGLYAPSYRERAERILQLSRQPGNETWPLDLCEFAALVARCTSWKLSPGSRGDVGYAFWSEALRHAEKLWSWELAQLTGGGAGTANDPMARWMRRQALAARMRGWLYVFRRQEKEGLSPVLRRFLSGGWRHSPRYGVYAAASRLFFRLPSFVAPGNSSSPDVFSEARDISATLPLWRNGKPEHASWQELAAEIIWNYNRFLVETRS